MTAPGHRKSIVRIAALVAAFSFVSAKPAQAQQQSRGSQVEAAITCFMALKDKSSSGVDIEGDPQGTGTMPATGTQLKRKKETIRGRDTSIHSNTVFKKMDSKTMVVFSQGKSYECEMPEKPDQETKEHRSWHLRFQGLQGVQSALLTYSEAIEPEEDEKEGQGQEFAQPNRKKTDKRTKIIEADPKLTEGAKQAGKFKQSKCKPSAKRDESTNPPKDKELDPLIEDLRSRLSTVAATFRADKQQNPKLVSNGYHHALELCGKVKELKEDIEKQQKEGGLPGPSAEGARERKQQQQNQSSPRGGLR